MKKFQLLIIITASSILQCCGADNGELTIYNDCDRTIRVYYENEYEEYHPGVGTYEENSTVETDSNVKSISSGHKKTIETSSDITYDGSIEAVYGGIVKEFNIHFDFFDTATIHISNADFYKKVIK